ncbi:MAG: HNH endonuclease [Alphaproteobacteria bacterium]|nr:HNH endonuclease [Alphaproteobacteria bacterium]
MQAALESCPTLVLNADFRPLSYFPLSIWPWQEAIKATLLGRVNTVAEYNRVIRSPSVEMMLPSVVSLKQYIKPADRPAFTRFNVFLRDKFTCQYSGQRLPAHELTFDHVLPRSRGGHTCWENVVTASSEYNLRKGNRTPKQAGLKLRQQPRRPNTWELLENGRSFPPNYLHESWCDYLYWDTELER